MGFKKDIRERKNSFETPPNSPLSIKQLGVLLLPLDSSSSSSSSGLYLSVKVFSFQQTSKTKKRKYIQVKMDKR